TPRGAGISRWWMPLTRLEANRTKGRKGAPRVTTINPVDDKALPLHAAEPRLLFLCELINGARELLKQVVLVRDISLDEIGHVTVFQTQQPQTLRRDAVY